MAEALVAFGGNVGDVRDTLDRAVAAFCDDGVRLRRALRPTTAPRPGGSRTSRPSSISASPSKPASRHMRCWRGRKRWNARSGATVPRSSAGAHARVDIDLLAYDDMILREPGPHAAAPAPVRSRLRAGAARRDCARKGDRRHAHGRCARAGRHQRRGKAAATIVVTAPVLALAEPSCAAMIIRPADGCWPAICSMAVCDHDIRVRRATAGGRISRGHP